jgi:hypothetical protein
MAGFLLIASITNTRPNCKSTLLSVINLLTSYLTVFLILRYPSLLLLNQITRDFNLEISLLRLSDTRLLCS